MNYDIRLTVHAHHDIFEIVRYISDHDSHSKADYVYDKIMNCLENLKTNPERGHIPKEMEKIAISSYLEIHFKPYRIIYTIEHTIIRIQCILDGRRELEDLLHKRLHLNETKLYNKKNQP